MAYTDEELLEKLRELASELGETPTTEAIDEAENYPSANTYIRHFGSVPAAREAAQLKRDVQEFTDEELLELLYELSVELGHIPTTDDINDADNYPSAGIYHSRFSSYSAAKEAAGFGNPDYEYSDEQLLEEVRNLADKLGRPPSESDLENASNYPSVDVYRVRFGSWQEAKIAVALSENNNDCNNEIKEELIAQLREFAEELGHSPTKEEFAQAEDYLRPSEYIECFGSWNRAKWVADLEMYSVNGTKTGLDQYFSYGN